MVRAGADLSRAARLSCSGAAPAVDSRRRCPGRWPTARAGSARPAAGLTRLPRRLPPRRLPMSARAIRLGRLRCAGQRTAALCGRPGRPCRASETIPTRCLSRSTDRQPADLNFQHLLGHLFDRLVFVAPAHLLGHHFAERRAIGRAPVRDTAHREVPVGHDAHETLAVAHRHGADVELIHRLRRELHRVLRRKRAHARVITCETWVLAASSLKVLGTNAQQTALRM